MGHAIISHSGFYAQNSLDKNTALYHIFSLDHFKQMLDSKSIYYSRVVKWADTFEYPIRFMPEDRRLNIEKCLYGFCLSKNYDKEAMWKLYSGRGECGVCIKTTATSICNAFFSDSGKLPPGFYDAFIGNVKYVSYLDTNPSRMFDEKEKYEYPDYMYPAYLKRDAYYYEEEVRILVYNLSMISQASCNGIFLDLQNFSFIHEIILSPYYPKDKLSTFYKLCEQYRMNVKIRQSDFLQKIEENSVVLPSEDKVYWGLPKNAYNIIKP